jgi:hypothetical protein
VLGALVRSRRGLDVKDIELLVPRHRGGYRIGWSTATSRRCHNA